jgi:response regulator RpfG family c-di-GMP phosphodiesterase
MYVIDYASSILICDDSEFDLAVLSNYLEDEGYSRVTIINDSRQVLPLLDSESFDLLLFDVKMPHIDGIELTRQVRQRHSEAELPILVVTATITEETLRQSLANGANDYLGKPFNRDEMSLRIRNLLRIRQIYKQQVATENNLQDLVATRTAKLDMLIKNGIMMSMERDQTALLRHILVEGQHLLHCDGATMYLLTEQNTLSFAMRTKDDALPSFEIPLYNEQTGAPNEKHVSTYVALHNESIVIDDVYQETRFDLSGTRRFDQESHYRTVSMLTVPMAPRDGEVLGVLQFMNALDPTTGAPVPFAKDLLALVEALASQAAVALDNLQLVEAQKELTDNMIKVIATAIDAKSPYTGRHCSRVPELALLLAEAAHKTRTGPLADFHFSTPDEWREFRTGAWLHDCGKMTTPEYVIDKATKLETIYNRIHEIRMRFEVLLRDAEIAQLKTLLAGDNPAEAEARLAARKAELLDDFAFVAECNLGQETTTDERRERLKRIAATTWLRHFDDRLGLSHEEAARYPTTAPPLPTAEPLLANQPQHLLARDAEQRPDPRFGFKMDIPEYLYNRGELYNLSIQRGTLTEEERYKINEHMVYTIMMLEQMNFPKYLQRVPEYAGTHHEGLHGHGYPRRLTAPELSVPSRIMAIADIFEALTAPDRPYKRPMKVSEAIKVLHGLKTSRQIDADLFDLFLTSGTYQRYAEKHLKAEQMDEVDISPLLGPLPETSAAH